VTEDVVDMEAVVVVAAMVAANLEDTRVVVVVEGEVSRMPMGSRNRPTNCFIADSLRCHLF